MKEYHFVYNLYMVAAYDISAPDKPVSVFFDSGDGDYAAALPNGEMIQKSGDYIYYATGYDSVHRSSWAPETLRWDLTNRRLTVLNELYLQRGIYSVGVFNNSIWCMAGYSDATLWNMNTNQSYDFGEIGFDTSEDILSTDGYTFGRYGYQGYPLWTANSDTIYFYRDSANEIRRIYGK